MKTKMNGGSTLFSDSIIVFGGINGIVYALNKYNGEVLWNFRTLGTITSTPVTSGKYVYVTSFDSRLYCLDGLTGTNMWDHVLENKSRTTPVIWRNYLFVAADRSLICFTNRKIEKTK
jgi:outer membrane protein assembly factor BamB